MLKATRLRCLNGTESFCNMETEKTFQVWRSLRSLWREESQQQRDVTVHEHWQLSETKSIAGSCKEGAYNLSHWFGKLPTNSTLRVLDMQVDYEARNRERALKEANRYFPFLDVKIHRP